MATPPARSPHVFVNKGALLSFGTLENPKVDVTQVAEVQKGYMFPAGVPGHIFIIGEPPIIRTGPQKITFDGVDPCVSLFWRVSNDEIYMVGLPVSSIIELDKPAAGKKYYDEIAILQSWKVSLASIKSVEPLERTETHDLPKLLQKQLKYFQVFDVRKLTEMKHFQKHAERGYLRNVKDAVLYAEKLERGSGAARGASAGDDSESVAAGATAKDKLADAKTNLERWQEHYEGDFSKKLHVLKVEDGKFFPAPDEFERMREELKCARAAPARRRPPCRTRSLFSL